MQEAEEDQLAAGQEGGIDEQEDMDLDGIGPNGAGGAGGGTPPRADEWADVRAEWATKQQQHLSEFRLEETSYPAAKYVKLGSATSPEYYMVGEWSSDKFNRVRFSDSLLGARLPGADGSKRFSVAIGSAGRYMQLISTPQFCTTNLGFAGCIAPP